MCFARKHRQGTIFITQAPTGLGAKRISNRICHQVYPHGYFMYGGCQANCCGLIPFAMFYWTITEADLAQIYLCKQSNDQPIRSASVELRQNEVNAKQKDRRSSISNPAFCASGSRRTPSSAFIGHTEDSNC